MSAAHEEMRRTMSSTLNKAAEAALGAEAVKREAAEAISSNNRLRHAPGSIAPAILTGEGTAKARRRWFWISIATVVMVALPIILIASRSDSSA